MPTITITSAAELAAARTTLRKDILAQQLPLALCAQAVATLTTLGELILKSHLTCTLETEIMPQQGNGEIQIKGVFPKRVAENLDLVQNQLRRAVDTVEIVDKDQQLHITIYIRADKNQ